MKKNSQNQFKPANAPHETDGLGGKNLLIAIFFSLCILGGFHVFYEQPRLERLEANKARMAQTEQVDIERGEENKALSDLADLETKKTRTRPVSGRIEIDTKTLKGSVDLTGARIDQLFLEDYKISIDSDQDVQLLASSEEKYPYYAEFGWLTGNSNIKMPNANTIWSFAKNSPKKLTPNKPVTLQWNNGQGLLFTREITLDEHYLFTINDTVENNTGENLALYPFGLISRHNVEESANSLFILHEGPIGYMDGDLEEPDYDDLEEDGEIKVKDTDGWIGFTDKYWLTALIPTPNSPKDARFSFVNKNGVDQYQADIRSTVLMVENGAKTNYTQNFFAGAKKLSILEDYEEKLNVEHLDLAIDFGWFYFMTKPFFLVLNFIYPLVGNFGVAIIIFTIMLRLCMFPLANKAFRSMARMKQITPKIQKLKERYGDDRMELQQKIMELYQSEKVSPLSGCAPMILQIPIFFALYKVLFVTIEMRHAPFFGWIQDLSQPDPTSLFNLFGLIPWDPPSFLMIGALPVIMCGTLIFQQMLNPKPQDPIQAKMMMGYPFFITYILSGFPAGLVVYWTFSNIFSVAQQYFIMRSMGVPIGRSKKAEEARQALNEEVAEQADKFIDNDEAQRRRKELKQKKKELMDKTKKSKKPKGKKK